MQITWLGHSAVKIEGSKILYIDPFLTGNPAASIAAGEVTEADIVVVTHDHGDHLGDAFPICKRTGAVLVSQHEIAVMAQQKGLTAEGMNVGGTVDVGGTLVHMVNALHTTQTGHPTGVVIQMDGKTLYHAGDTGLTYDMKLVGEFFHPDLSFLPIGDRFTMGIRSAARAAEFCGTRKVIPIHYNTFPLVTADPRKFADLVGDKAEVIVLNPGESYTLS